MLLFCSHATENERGHLVIGELSHYVELKRGTSVEEVTVISSVIDARKLRTTMGFCEPPKPHWEEFLSGKSE